MTLLSSLAPAPNSLSPPPSDAAATAAGAGRGARVRAVEYLAPVRDPLQDRTRQAGQRQAGLRQSGLRQAGERQPQNQRALALRPEDERSLGLAEPRWPDDGGLETAVSSLFLVQVFGQDQTPRQVAPAADEDGAHGDAAHGDGVQGDGAHRDAAVLGSDAYRRAGATPPVYSERPTLFRIVV